MNERISIADKKPGVNSQNPVPQIRRKTESFRSMNSPVDRILFLQKTIGNQAVTKLIKLGALQAKLKIGQPGDIYEQEADRIADQMMATPVHQAVSGAQPRIQRFSGQSNGQTDSAPASVDQALASPGRPLEPVLRQDMEQRFGHDFSKVRVHTDADAERSARDVNANAYTVGHNIVLGAGRFAPGTHEGRRLIAHELIHVVQQSRQESEVIQRQEQLQQPLGKVTDIEHTVKIEGNPANHPNYIQNSIPAVGILGWGGPFRLYRKVVNRSGVDDILLKRNEVHLYDDPLSGFSGPLNLVYKSRATADKALSTFRVKGIYTYWLMNASG